MMNRTVCIPILSLKILLYLKIIKGNNNYTVFYELMPRYIRGIIKLFNISEKKICFFINMVFGFELNRIQHGDYIKNYNNIRLNIYIKIVEICEKFLSEVKNDVWYNLLEDIIKKNNSVSTSIKFLATKQLHIHLLSAKLTLEETNQKLLMDSEIILFNSYSWPDKLLNIINEEKYFSKIKFKKLPVIFHIFNKLNNIISLFLILFRYVTIHGIVFNKIKKKSFRIATEIFDLNMLGRSPNDTDFFIDQKNFTNSNSIFYITSNNYRILKQNGYETKEIKRIAKKRNLTIIELRKLPVHFKSALDLIKWVFNVSLNCFTKKTSFIFNLLPLIIKEHFNYVPLFQHFDFKHHIHFMANNGRATLLLNSGIITGLCRQYKVHSNGIQNRPVDARQYEFSFYSYDTYFAWGQAWVDSLGSTLKFVNKIVIVGTFNLTKNLYEEAAKFKRKNKKLNNHINSVIIFPTDIDLTTSVYSGAFYTFSYFINFLKNCLVLAEKYPEIDFSCKLKDYDQIKLIETHNDFKKLNIQSYKNFKFINRERMNYADLLIKNDMSISIGFTSPGIDFILLNKKSIYFSELKNAGKAFKRVPNFVVENQDDLILVFDKLVSNKIEYINKNLLDPFQDGKSINRIINHLSMIN